ncbi:MAG: helix-turn-helix domain-containing protein [Betaproteobacteria bacterium]|nr:helix-turn-helix domain-containing protein [Betaproteobacteria bacterium]
MGRTLAEIIDSLPIEEQTAIAAHTQTLIELYALRRTAGKTQAEVAATMGVGQDTISRLERRGDMLLSTLRHYVESVGGRLDLVVHLPGEAPVVIDPLAHRAVRQPKTTAG